MKRGRSRALVNQIKCCFDLNLTYLEDVKRRIAEEEQGSRVGWREKAKEILNLDFILVQTSGSSVVDFLPVQKKK